MSGDLSSDAETVPTLSPVSPSAQPPGRLEAWTRGFTLLTTSVTKMAGVAIGIHEAFQPVPDSRVLAIAAIMIAGIQWSEGLLLSVIDRFMGRPPGQDERK